MRKKHKGEIYNEQLLWIICPNSVQSSVYYIGSKHTHTRYLGIGPQKVKDGRTLGMEGVFESFMASALQMSHVRLETKRSICLYM